MESEHMLTTLDNPYNPFSQFEEWLAFDILKGHNTCELLDLYTYSSTSISEEDQHISIEDAILHIVQEDVEGIYIRVTKDFYISSNDRHVELPMYA